MDCLIIDDEQSIAKTICKYFNLFGVTAEYTCDYDSGLALLAEKKPSLVLLDVNLGEKSGFDFCKKLREDYDIPVMFISARDTDDDILMALGVGGDDYIVKPFTNAVLLAKVKAMMKRSAVSNPVSLSKSSVIVFGDIEINREAKRVMRAGETVRLRPLEFKMLLYLYDNGGKCITKEELLDNIWGDAFVDEGVLSVNIRHLREKLEKDPKNPEYIKTIWGSGYLFELEGSK